MTDAPAPQRDRTLIVILCVIGALVVIALIVVFTRGAPAQLDASSPEGVVQRYATAVIDGDEDAAMEYLVPELADSCERVDPGVRDLRVTLDSTAEREDTADVRVLISISYDGGLFGSSDYEEEGTFDLVADDGGWLIESAPWPLTICMPAVS
ncbi:hypothetical protein [Agromyces sp. Marseille-P2726]|uniref:hypothetical protein n=1 Tax=Agromyces sp. Marseille-P2726 TaxID=2709132 RepID=UPI00156F4436|nr:hypothetical protein [Agromyces sp. Marseille-P2726]